MEKEVRAIFKLTDKEIKEALYDFYVKKLKANNINALFSEKDIKLEHDNSLDVILTIIEIKTIE